MSAAKPKGSVSSAGVLETAWHSPVLASVGACKVTVTVPSTRAKHARRTSASRALPSRAASWADMDESAPAAFTLHLPQVWPPPHGA